MSKVIQGILIWMITGISVMSLILFLSNHFVTVTSYSLAYENLPSSFDNFKIVQLSDLHSHEFGKDNKQLIRKIQKLEPDIVVLTGDMVTATDESFSEFINLAQQLTQQYPVYYVVGNHEQIFEEAVLNELYASLRECGVEVLDNERAKLQINDDVIYLVGMWFNLRYYSDQTKEVILNDPQTYYFDLENMSEVLGEKPDEFSILLTHNPVYFPTYAAWGADLTLSGHMHGGMVRIPFVGGIMSPEKTWFPIYDEGLFEIEDKNLVVSRGLSAGHKGFRFWNCPQLVEITLHQK